MSLFATEELNSDSNRRRLGRRTADSDKRKKHRLIARTRAKELLKQQANPAATGYETHQLSIDFKGEKTEFLATVHKWFKMKMNVLELHTLTLTAAPTRKFPPE